ncbi:PRTRC system ParB family protein [Methylomonas sp. AM2-LC]|uniref:PRTRC system ParB family protein n=1 Tax=Methylomonas sp. AM2-LC TaxID=3153301 RepID=UPI003264A50A
MSENQNLSYVPVSEIKIKDGFNPRKYFDENKLQELVDSIMERGVIQSIVIRPIDDQDTGYWVVAGERRYRAAIMAGLETIPAKIMELDDQAANLVALIENSARDDISPAEEAQSAQKVLMACNNDRQEAQKLLGWSSHKFESRMMLLHADEKVLDALTSRKIKLGHAELLSQLDKEFQVNTLQRIIENGFTVPVLKSRLEMYSMDLSKACFNTNGCNGCRHNSTMQASIFDENIGSGRCANRDCWEKKSIAAMEVKKDELSEKYAVVYLDIERTTDSFSVVCQSGDSGVGKTQFEQGCKQCAHFGAILSTSPDARGRITEDCCFNLPCHKDKVTEYQKSLKETIGQHKNGSGVVSDKKETNTSVVNADTNSIKEKSKTSQKAVVAETPQKVIEHIECFYRQLGAKTVEQNRIAVLSLNTYALYKLLGSNYAKDLIPELSGNKKTYESYSPDAFISEVSALGMESIMEINKRLLSKIVESNDSGSGNRVWAQTGALVCGLAGINLQHHFVVDKVFLGGFTKSGIEAILREAINGQNVSFIQHYEKPEEKKTVSSLMKKKNAEILDDVFSCGYDFTGFVPNCVTNYSKIQVRFSAQEDQCASDNLHQKPNYEASHTSEVIAGAVGVVELNEHLFEEIGHRNEVGGNEPLIEVGAQYDVPLLGDSKPISITDEDEEILNTLAGRSSFIDLNDQDFTKNPDDEEEEDISYV